MEKVIVTGGAGFIGSHIVDALVAEGYEVHILDNFSSGKQENCNEKAIVHEIDVRNAETLVPLFENTKYVFHHAALPQVQYSLEHPAETHEINVTGLLNVLEAARVHGVKRLIFSASSAAYGNQDTLPVVETMDARPLSPYGAHKYIGEVYCALWSRVYNLETASLRYFNVYGPRQSSLGAYASVIAKFMDLQKENKALIITGDGEQTRDFVHVSDVVRANLLAMKASSIGHGEVINIGSGKQYSVHHIASIVGGPVEYAPARIESRDTQADIVKAKQLLGWEPYKNIEEGILELKKIYTH